MRTLITICAAIELLGFNLTMAGTWTTPQPVGGVVNTTDGEYSPCISSDGLSLYFTRWADHAGIYQATRTSTSGPFTSVDELTGLGAGVFDPWVSSDNLRMYYAGPGWNINMSQRASVIDEWTMGTDVSGIALGMACHPSLTADELTMVFVGGNPSGDAQGSDLYMATRPNKNSPFSNIIALANLNTDVADGGPDITPDGLSLYFASNRNGNYEIFQSSRDSINGPFGLPNHLSVFDNLNVGSGAPSLSSDGTALYFHSGYPQDIYVSYNVPEPATILLFTLGSLILRRKH